MDVSKTCWKTHLDQLKERQEAAWDTNTMERSCGEVYRRFYSYSNPPITTMTDNMKLIGHAKIQGGTQSETRELTAQSTEMLLWTREKGKIFNITALNTSEVRQIWLPTDWDGQTGAFPVSERWPGTSAEGGEWYGGNPWLTCSQFAKMLPPTRSTEWCWTLSSNQSF